LGKDAMTHGGRSRTPGAQAGSPDKRIRRLVCRSVWHWLAMGLLWCSASGAGCPRMLQQYTQPIPRALPPSASLAQVVDVVNDNSSRVHSLSTTQATVTTPGFPALTANIAFQRPRSLRLVAQKFGPQVDLGSNDELFWFWMRQSQPPAMFFCRHDQFTTSAARTILPVEPDWLIEAFGVVNFDTAQPIDGPFPVGNGRLEFRTRTSAAGPGTSRIVIVDDSRGVVLEDHVYDSHGVRLASAILSKHTRDAASSVTLPRHVEIQFPPTKMELAIDMPDLQVNQLSAPPHELFTKPVYPGYNEVNLAQPGGALTPSAAGPAGASPSVRY
jgi:hypothetical protein